MAIKLGRPSGNLIANRTYGRLNNLVRQGLTAHPRQFPDSAAAWAAAFPSVPLPVAIWTCQEASNPVLDKIGSNNLVQNLNVLYFRLGDPEPIGSPRRSIGFNNSSTNTWTGPTDTTFGDIPQGGSLSIYVRFDAPDSVAASRGLVGKGGPGALVSWNLQINSTTGVLRSRISDGSNVVSTDSSMVVDDNVFHDGMLCIDSTNNVIHNYCDDSFSSAALDGVKTTIDASGLTPALGFRVGGGSNGLGSFPGEDISYVALFNVALSVSQFDEIRGLT